MIDVTQMKCVSDNVKRVIFADTDALSSFLWRGRFGLFLKLFEKLQIIDIEAGTAEYHTYLYLTEEEGMGKGEAAALSMAKHSEYIASVASNNLSDIWEYVEKNKIDLWTTARIIYECQLEEIMTKESPEQLWKKMVEDGDRLPFDNYNEYVKRKKGENKTRG